MRLFAHRFLTAFGPELACVPGRFDENRSLRVNETGQPVVDAPANGDRSLTLSQVGTRGEIDPQASPDMMGTVTKTAETDRDDLHDWTLPPVAPRRPTTAALLTTRTAGGLDEQRDSELSVLQMNSASSSDRNA